MTSDVAAGNTKMASMFVRSIRTAASSLRKAAPKAASAAAEPAAVSPTIAAAAAKASAAAGGAKPTPIKTAATAPAAGSGRKRRGSRSAGSTASPAAPAGARTGLNLFFEDTAPAVKNERAEQMSTGRAWRASELRTHTFEDLHKLWYVLLRERNMLMTQKHESRVQRMPFLGVSRLIKVKQGMARIKTVIHERSVAFQEAQYVVRRRQSELQQQGLSAPA